MTPGSPSVGVRIAGSSSSVPPGVLENSFFEHNLDTSDEWIRKRTGIHRRHIVDPKTEGQFTIARDALGGAMDRSGLDPAEVDLVINASVTSEMTCPSNASRIAADLGMVNAAAFDLVAACSGMVYSMNLADTLIRSGRHKTIGIVGADALSQVVDYEERTVSILFGDGAGAMVLTADPDQDRGCFYQTMGGDGSGWPALYMPRKADDVPEQDAENPIKLGMLRMNGREVFKFAVSKFREVIEDALEKTGLTVDDVSQFVCHQSNVRIIQSAMERLGLPEDKVLVNIDEYGNTSAGSIGLVYDELVQGGRIHDGDIVVFVAFGGGLTWASSVWRV